MKNAVYLPARSSFLTAPFCILKSNPVHFSDCRSPSSSCSSSGRDIFCQSGLIAACEGVGLNSSELLGARLACISCQEQSLFNPLARHSIWLGVERRQYLQYFLSALPRLDISMAVEPLVLIIDKLFQPKRPHHHERKKW